MPDSSNKLTGYDAHQVLRSVFDVANCCLRVCVVGSDAPGGGSGALEVIISHTDDSIRLGDGINLVTTTTVGLDVGLDVNVLNDINVNIDAADGDSVLIKDPDGHTLDINSKGQAATNDSLDCGGINKIITVFDTPVEIKVNASRKSDRKTVYARPLGKGIHWGWQNNITADETSTGGDPLFRFEPLILTATANTPVYLVGPVGGVKVFISEA